MKNRATVSTGRLLPQETEDWTLYPGSVGRMFINHLSVAVVTSRMLYTPTSLPPVDLALEPQTVSSCPLLSPLGYLLRHLTLACVQTQRLRFPPKLLSPSNPGPPLHDKRQLYPFSSSGQKSLRILPAFSFPLKLRSKNTSR